MASDLAQKKYIGSFCNYPSAAASNRRSASTAEAAYGRSVSVQPLQPATPSILSAFSVGRAHTHRMWRRGSLCSCCGGGALSVSARARARRPRGHARLVRSERVILTRHRRTNEHRSADTEGEKDEEPSDVATDSYLRCGAAMPDDNSEKRETTACA